MSIDFCFETAGRVEFGQGKLALVPKIVEGLGGRILLVTGGNPDRWPLRKDLLASGLDIADLQVVEEPTIELVRHATEESRRQRIEVVVAIGGGSVLDAGKAIAALALNPGDPLDYVEVIGRGLELSQPALPCVAIPTTAGTGAEVTRNAVLGSRQEGVKVSLRSSRLLPRFAVVDPILTVSTPPRVTAYSGLDAAVQVLEAFVSRRGNPLIDGLCREALQLVSQSLMQAFRQGTDLQAREKMALVALIGGFALANAGLGAVHGFAGPLGGMTGAPHGALCARLVPFVVQANLQALADRDQLSPALSRYDEAARLLTGDPGAEGAQLGKWFLDCCFGMGIPALSGFGLTPEQISDAVRRSQQASSMKGNPVSLTVEELTGILERAL